MSEIKILNAGEQGLVVEFGTSIDPLTNAKVRKLNELLQTASLVGIIETVPTYRSLLIYFNPLLLSRKELEKYIKQQLPTLADVQASKQGRLVMVPVCYDAEFGEDLDFVCQHTALTPTEIITMHTQPEYLVYMIGFMAGFPYLGGMDERLATPRLKQPRTIIPAGSVGIADKQTGIYPVASPGGWQLIGRTPVPIYNPRSEQPFLFATGDYLKFVSVSKQEYFKIEQAVQRGEYRTTYATIGGGT